jgi:hypothetical protein
MKRFIAEQTFAVKHFSLSHPQGATDGRFAMAWSPGNLVCPTGKLPPEKSLAPCSSAVFAQLTGGILDRLASSIRYAYEQGRASQAGACGPPGDHSWCTADIPTAAFNPLWNTYPDWNAG